MLLLTLMKFVAFFMVDYIDYHSVSLLCVITG